MTFNKPKVIVDGLEKGARQRKYPHPSEAMSINITGYVVNINDNVIQVSWYGGGQLEFSKDILVGDWHKLLKDEWFEAVIWREHWPSCKIIRAVLNKKIQTPQCMTQKEIDELYKTISPAKLEPL